MRVLVAYVADPPRWTSALPDASGDEEGLAGIAVRPYIDASAGPTATEVRVAAHELLGLESQQVIGWGKVQGTKGQVGNITIDLAGVDGEEMTDFSIDPARAILFPLGKGLYRAARLDLMPPEDVGWAWWPSTDAAAVQVYRETHLQGPGIGFRIGFPGLDGTLRTLGRSTNNPAPPPDDSASDKRWCTPRASA